MHVQISKPIDHLAKKCTESKVAAEATKKACAQWVSDYATAAVQDSHVWECHGYLYHCGKCGHYFSEFPRNVGGVNVPLSMKPCQATSKNS